MERKRPTCSLCGVQFSEVSSLRRHMKIHEGVRPYKCLFCSKTFRQAGQLKTHLRVHTGEKPFACKQCDKCFAQKCQLVSHCRMYHGEEKPFVCAQCGLRFPTSSNYKTHLRLHKGEKPYKCDVCGESFAQSSTLKYHKRRHTGEKPYQCDTCGMAFSVSSSLIIHRRKHTGEQPYKCTHPGCEQAFVSLADKKRHMRNIHADGNPGVKCLFCGKMFTTVKTMINHQEKAHSDELRKHKERARAVIPARPISVTFVPIKRPLSQQIIVASPISAIEPQPHTPDPVTPNPTCTTSDNILASQEPTRAESGISSQALQALVEQLAVRTASDNTSQIVIIRTVDTGEPEA